MLENNGGSLAIGEVNTGCRTQSQMVRSLYDEVSRRLYAVLEWPTNRELINAAGVFMWKAACRLESELTRLAWEWGGFEQIHSIADAKFMTRDENTKLAGALFVTAKRLRELISRFRRRYSRMLPLAVCKWLDDNLELLDVVCKRVLSDDFKRD